MATFFIQHNLMGTPYEVQFAIHAVLPFRSCSNSSMVAFSDNRFVGSAHGTHTVPEQHHLVSVPPPMGTPNLINLLALPHAMIRASNSWATGRTD